MPTPSIIYYLRSESTLPHLLIFCLSLILLCLLHHLFLYNLLTLHPLRHSHRPATFIDVRFITRHLPFRRLAAMHLGLKMIQLLGNNIDRWSKVELRIYLTIQLFYFLIPFDDRHAMQSIYFFLLSLILSILRNQFRKGIYFRLIGTFIIGRYYMTMFALRVGYDVVINSRSKS